MPRPKPPRKTITIDLPPEQIQWLDQQAAEMDRSRSSFIRTLISAQMKRVIS